MTFWAGIQFPDYIEDVNPNLKFSYYKCTKIENYNTVLILNDKDSLEHYLKNFQEIDSDYIEKINLLNSTIIYDGSWHPESYMIFINNTSVSFEKCNKEIIDFLGLDYINYEQQFK